ncbi:hypothetical protein [Sodalis glossinidius]|uniref:hypothetical protein n=1 Tax=Sodalis glossinidius TaxID=63612 RepID=UPI001FB16AAF|nr:hypothetical protein [Sodalis glossinidius]
MKLHYYDPHRLPAVLEEELGLTYHDTPESMVRVCDIVNVQTPLYPTTQGCSAIFKRHAPALSASQGRSLTSRYFLGVFRLQSFLSGGDACDG